MVSKILRNLIWEIKQQIKANGMEDAPVETDICDWPLGSDTDVADNDLYSNKIWLTFMNEDQGSSNIIYNHIQFWNVLQTQYILAILEAHVISSTQLQIL